MAVLSSMDNKTRLPAYYVLKIGGDSEIAIPAIKRLTMSDPDSSYEARSSSSLPSSSCGNFAKFPLAKSKAVNPLLSGTFTSA